jgi:hypothetical protein
MSKQLFNKYEAFNEEASRIAKNIRAAIMPIVKKEMDAGYKGRDLSSLASLVVENTICELILTKAMEIKKAERKKDG